jgi:hypothetical protein
MTDIKIEPTEEHQKASSLLKKYVVPIAGGIFVIIALIVVWLISTFYPPNYNDDIVQPDSQTQQ